MAQGQISLKRIGINKANSRIFAISAVAAFLVTFFLVSSFMLFSKLMYQNRVIGEKKKAVTQLEKNKKARDTLVTSYKAFVNAPQNMLHGVPDGAGPKDGSNAKLVLDALPSKYDFPALTSSLERLLTDQKVKITNMVGIDEEVGQSDQKSGSVATPVEIPFEVTVAGDYTGIQGVINAMEHSIRPFHILTTQITADKEEITLRLTGKTYYQPETTLNIEKKVVK